MNQQIIDAIQKSEGLTLWDIYEAIHQDFLQGATVNDMIECVKDLRDSLTILETKAKVDAPIYTIYPQVTQ